MVDDTSTRRLLVTAATTRVLVVCTVLIEQCFVLTEKKMWFIARAYDVIQSDGGTLTAAQVGNQTISGRSIAQNYIWSYSLYCQFACVYINETDDIVIQYGTLFLCQHFTNREKAIRNTHNFCLRSKAPCRYKWSLVLLKKRTIAIL